MVKHVIMILIAQLLLSYLSDIRDRFKVHSRKYIDKVLASHKNVVAIYVSQHYSCFLSRLFHHVTNQLINVDWFELF